MRSTRAEVQPLAHRKQHAHTCRNLFHAKRQQVCSTQAPAAAGPAPSTSSGALIVCNAFSVQPETRAPCCAYAQVCLQAAVCGRAFAAGAQACLGLASPSYLAFCSRAPGSVVLALPCPPSLLLQPAAAHPGNYLLGGGGRAHTHGPPGRCCYRRRRRGGGWAGGRRRAAGGGRRGAGERRAPPSLVYTPRLRSVRLFAEEGRTNNGSNTARKRLRGKIVSPGRLTCTRDCQKRQLLSDSSTK